MNPTPPEDTSAPSKITQTLTSPWRCLSGALIAGGMAIALYSLTVSIAHNFATKPLHSVNPLVINIGAAVRTLVVGVSMLATFVFGLVAIGLVALGVQVFVQQQTQQPPSDVE